MLIWISIEIDSIDSIDFVNISFYLYFHCQDFNKTFNYRFSTITFLWGLFRDFPFPLQEENWCRTKLNSNGQLRIFSFRKSHSRHVCSKLQNNEQIAEPICLLASKKCYDYQRSIGVSFYDYNTKCLCSKNNAKLKPPFLGKVNISALCNIDFNRKIISLNGLRAQPSSNMVSRKVRNRITVPGSKTKYSM